MQELFFNVNVMNKIFNVFLMFNAVQIELASEALLIFNC